MIPAVLIYSHTITPRLKYIADFFSFYYGLPFHLTSSEDGYRSSECKCKINYGYQRLEPGEIWIHSHVLLFETQERPVKIDCFVHNGFKAFFKAEGEAGFDILAAVFFLMVRYEEYLPHQKDAYGRFAYQNSVAYKEGFLSLPLVNIWLEDFRNLLSERDPSFRMNKQQFVFLPTYDIDMAWSYRNKGFLRNLGSLLLLFFTGRWNTLGRRISVLRGKSKDPFDAYEWMDDLHKIYDLHPLYFFLVAQRTGKYDRNISINNPEFIELIRELDQKYALALHPSWATGEFPSLFKEEKSWLESIIEKQVDASRQHYINFELPSTYRHLIEAGIKHDYSMGYGSINGFRASVATPFYWYDLKAEKQTTLMIHPFCFMDANSFYEQQQDPAKTIQELKLYIETVRSVHGTMITIWHNSFLGSDPAFYGWKEIYKEFIGEVAASSAPRN
ncbi:MAG: hypothetical protein H0U44_09720 [Flavisolibacter sp.]|jgi:hypothetical protein|nr:hypothetical protein [Flavisolibacter sp.]